MEEATRGTDIITVAENVAYKFGEEKQPMGDYPTPKITPHITYYNNSREPSDQHVASYEVVGQLGFVPVNGLEWYFFLGSSSSAADVHTISALDDGEKPTRTIRTESANASENLRYNYTYGKTAQLGFSVDLKTPNQFAAISNMIVCDQIKTSEAGYTITPSDPVANEPYAYASNFVFNWDQGGTPVDYSDVLLDFSYIGVDNLLTEYLDNQNYANWLLEGRFTHAINMTIERGSDKQIFTDFIAQLSSDTFKDCRLKIFNWGSTTLYTQLDFSSCMIIENTMNKTFSKKTEDGVYRVMALPKSLVVTNKDGINPTAGSGNHYLRDANYA
jgi:hypothetical protein